MELREPVPLQPLLYEETVRRALAEDLGRAGDITTDAIVPKGARAVGRLLARAPGRIAGLDVAAAAFTLLDAGVELSPGVTDGTPVTPGDVLLEVRGSARTILTGERVALNLLARLSGVATLTAEYVRAAAGARARVVCTRKTTPGLRALEKYAVRCGGGFNHRFGLDDAVLVKDNHIAVAGGLGAAVERVRAALGHTVVVEVEVDTLEQLDELLDLPVDAVLLDNMAPENLRRAVAMVDHRIVTEASGGINLETVQEIAASGVDLVSVGALTHSAPGLDLALEVTPA